MIGKAEITGVILAGGRGRRMANQDKGWVLFHGKPLIEHVTERIQPQVGQLLISANRNQARYAKLGWPVISDRLNGYQGPLAGLSSCMAATDTPWLQLAPCDTPLLPPDLTARLRQALGQHPARLAIPHDGQRLQLMCALISIELGSDLDDYLASGQRRLHSWCLRHDPLIVDFSDQQATFYNMNWPEDLQNKKLPQK